MASEPLRLGGPLCFGRGTKSEMAHVWAQRLPDLCRPGGQVITSGPHVGTVAT